MFVSLPARTHQIIPQIMICGCNDSTTRFKVKTGLFNMYCYFYETIFTSVICVFWCLHFFFKFSLVKHFVTFLRKVLYKLSLLLLLLFYYVFFFGYRKVNLNGMNTND